MRPQWLQEKHFILIIKIVNFWDQPFSRKVCPQPKVTKPSMLHVTVVPDWPNLKLREKHSTDRKTSFQFRRSVSNRTCAQALALIFSNDNLNNKPFGARSWDVLQCSNDVHVPLLTASENPDSMGLSFEVSLCPYLVSSHEDCDITEYYWLRCVSEEVSLKGDVHTQMP